MNIRLLSFLTLFFLTTSLFSQRQNPFLREFGMDLTWMIVAASGHNPVSTDVELIFKETHDKLDLRFKLLISSNFTERTLMQSSTTDSIQLLNYYRPHRTIALNLGVAYKKITRDLPIYVGVDAAIAWNSGDTEVDRCLIGDSCKRFQGLSNQHITVGVIPLLGTKLPLTDRLMFTVEFGTQINYHFGKRSYMNSEEVIKEYRIDGLELELNRLVNDIAILYLF